MDPLDFVTDEELSGFFHYKKTEISCMEEPQTFLNQLRDHNLVQEDLYQKVMRMKSKERRQKGVYQILDQLEKKRGHCIKVFWSCVFQDHILQKYPVLRLLRNSLMDGSFRFYEQLPDAPEEPNKNEKESVQKKEKTGKEMKTELKRKKSTEKTEEEEPGPSSCSTPQQKKPEKKPKCSSPLKKGEKPDVWTWGFFKTQLLVTCGNKKGTLYKDKLAKGEKCILSEKCWFTPGGFEKFAGKESSKNWKLSIRCQNTPLLKLIKKGHLKAPRAKRSCVREKVQFTDTSPESSSSSGSSSPQSTSSVELVELSDDDQDEQGKKEIRLQEEVEEEDEESEPVDLSIFEAPSLPVSCGSFSGVLYKSRFTGACSKSIRTEERWFTPEEFVNQESTLTDAHWRKDILCHGKTLHYLVKKKILFFHSLLCPCDHCHNKEPDNDDICFICNSEGDLVCCDECPRAFHDNCHLPNLQKETLGDKWTCTYCVLKAYQGLWLPMTQKEVLNRPLSGNIMRCEYLLLCLYKEDQLRVFTGDPTVTVEGYSRWISKPMWLDRVKTKLQNKEYKTVGEFVNDVRLIFQNCSKFNMDNVFDRMGSRMNKIFEQDFHKVFNIVSHVGSLTYNDPRQINKSNINPNKTLDFPEDKGKISSMKEEDNFPNKLHIHNQLLANTEVFTPKITTYEDSHVYRFLCSNAGQFQCTMTNLIFKMERKAEVQYGVANWESSHLDGIGEMQPAGPLYNIECFKGSIYHLHLPHCETDIEHSVKLAVAHFTGGNLEIIQPLKVTDSHVIIDVQGLSLFGLLKVFENMLFPTKPINAQVLLFHEKLTDIQISKLYIHLLPGNVPVEEVKKHQQSCTYIKTSSRCQLIPCRQYKPCCGTYKPQPKIETFDTDYGPNYHPTFEVLINTKVEEITVGLLDENDQEVWEPRQVFLTAGCSQDAATSNVQNSGAEFVDRHREALIQRVSSVMEMADSLLSRNIISNEDYDMIRVEKTSQEQMRALYNHLNTEVQKSEFYKIITEKQPLLLADLIRFCSSMKN
ncbi:uncharacterized protein LOC134333981 isoform X2 [Trichomycterus rosablanca]|uniref:uncharacterized protein LOC134333981 isoform X2 n=1 Tax=Trichomycterus rosablanca TaxID=2290929 RepID=UPI002F3609B6